MENDIFTSCFGDVDWASLNGSEVIIDRDLEDFDDLIDLARRYDPRLTYNIPLENIKKIEKHIKEIKKLVGLESIKESIFENILYLLKNDSENQHISISGGPGSGKTTLANILGGIYNTLKGNEDRPYTETPTRLVSSYIGQTSNRTREALEKARGGVLIIDDIYPFNRFEQREFYTNEFVETLIEFMDDPNSNILIILTGNKDSLETLVFLHSPALSKKFGFRYDLNLYSPGQLLHIFRAQAKRDGWYVESKLKSELFVENRLYFQNQGRDCKNFLHKCKTTWIRKNFCKSNTGKITRDIARCALEKFKKEYYREL